MKKVENFSGHKKTPSREGAACGDIRREVSQAKRRGWRRIGQPQNHSEQLGQVSVTRPSLKVQAPFSQVTFALTADPPLRM